MNFEPLEKIANAVLYEGFLLYPYRKSAAKNQQRWHFGTIGAPGGADPVLMQTECLIEDEGEPSLDIKIRFLQIDAERELSFPGAKPGTNPFSFSQLEGSVEFERHRLSDQLSRFTVRIRNLSKLADPACSMLSTHTMLGVRQGAFISLLDPPDEYRDAAAGCRNIGSWPVMSGREGERSLMLSSPIILYDYPQIAPESAGDFFDGTEIDEMLTLRMLTLSDEEKREVQAGGGLGRQILERTEALPPEHLAKLHGAIRSLRNSARLSFREGDRVRLRPQKKSDIFDIALDGKIAVIESVEQDFEDRVHLAVVVEDDPGRDLGAARQIGHRFFFSPDEVELL